MLILDAEQKHFHQINKYYMKSIEKYMKYGKYLLVKIQENQANFNGIYLPKYVKVVHFGELEIAGGGGGGIGNGNLNVDINGGDVKTVDVNGGDVKREELKVGRQRENEVSGLK